MAEPLIRFANVSKTFYQKSNAVIALDGIDLTIQSGTIFGIIGLSGAGKSTLIRSINRLETPQTGSVTVSGLDITKLDANALRQARRKIGMIFQHFNLLHSRTVYGNIAFPLEIAGLKPTAIEARVRELAELVGLSDKLTAYPHQLSGGQKQRVGIARALANHPEILLCDEATSALDPQTTRSILKLLRELNQQLGLTIVLITHEIHVVKEICDFVAILEQGKIVEQGPVVEVFARPQTELAREFIRTALNYKDSEEIRQLHGALATDNRKLVRISFVGEKSHQPIISSLIHRYRIDINILYANIDLLKDTPFGSLTVELAGTAALIADSLQYLTEQGLQIEVLNCVEPTDLEFTR